MALIDNIITTNLTGEAINYAYDSTNLIKIAFKQTWSVTLDTTNFKYIITSSLYTKLEEDASPDYDGVYFDYIHLSVGNDTVFMPHDNGHALIVNKNTGITVNGVDISSDASVFTKIFEHTATLDCTTNGRIGVRLSCGTISGNYFPDYTLITLQLALSGLWYYRESTVTPDLYQYVRVMPWMKVNGQWKRAYVWGKHNGEWQKPYDEW